MSPFNCQDKIHQPNKTILLVGTFLSHTGRPRSVCEDLATQLNENGWNVITTSRLPYRLPRMVDILTTIWKFRRQYHIAQIDVYSGTAFVWAEVAGWLLNAIDKKYILTLHGGNLPSFASRWPGRVTRLLRYAAAVTIPSRYLWENMQRYRKDLHLLHNPLDISAYKHKVRHKPRPHLIWLRAFHEIYNPTLAPRVLAQLSSDFPNACLTMVGPDKGDGSLEETQRVARDLCVLDRINFPGGVPKADVPNWLNKGDIFINTTNVDNTPVSVIEAMACGLCVISTNVGGIPYLLEDEKDALLVPPNNPPAMAAMLNRIMIEPGLGKRLSNNAREKVKMFDWSVVLPQWETLLANNMESFT